MFFLHFHSSHLREWKFSLFPDDVPVLLTRRCRVRRCCSRTACSRTPVASSSSSSSSHGSSPAPPASSPWVAAGRPRRWPPGCATASACRSSCFPSRQKCTGTRRSGRTALRARGRAPSASTTAGSSGAAAHRAAPVGSDGKVTSGLVEHGTVVKLLRWLYQGGITNYICPDRVKLHQILSMFCHGGKDKRIVLVSRTCERKPGKAVALKNKILNRKLSLFSKYCYWRIWNITDTLLHIFQ